MAIAGQVIRVGLQQGDSDKSYIELLQYLRGNPTSTVTINTKSTFANQRTSANTLTPQAPDLQQQYTGALQAQDRFIAQYEKNQQRIRQITNRFAAKPTSEESFANLFGQRTRYLEEQAKTVAQRYSNIQAELERSLVNKIQSGAVGKIGGITNLGNGANLLQIALAGTQGLGAVGSTVTGSLLGGAAGALVGNLVQSTIIEPLNEKRKDFEETGRALSGAVLSIASSLQQSTQGISSSGKTLTDPARTIAFNERQALAIQTEARKSLLPLGIGGEQEATTVRAVVGALGNRGIVASPSEIAQISKTIASVVSVQRPELLNNSTLYNRDVNDLLSGGAQAQRTILGSLLKQSVPALQNASSADDIVKALQKYSGVAEVAATSQNTTAVLNRLTGAQNQLDTIGGASYFNALRPSLNYQTEILKSGEAQEASERLGRALGTLSGLATNASANLTFVGNSLVNATGHIVDFFSNHLPQFGTKATAGKLGEPLGSEARPELQIGSELKSLGLDSALEDLKANRGHSTGNQLSGLLSLQQRFGSTDAFKEIAPQFYQILGDKIGSDIKARSGVFGSSLSGQISTNELTRQALPEQISAVQNRLSALTEQLNALPDHGVQTIANSGARTSLQNEIADARRSLIELRTQAPNLLREQANQYLTLAKQASSGFDTSTSVGAASAAKESQPFLEQAFTRQSGVIKGLDALLNELSTQRQQLQKEIAATGNVLQRSSLQKSLNDLDQLEAVKNREHQEAQRGLNEIESQRIRNFDQSFESQLLKLRETRGGFNPGTIDGQSAISQNKLQEANKTIDYVSQQSNLLQDAINRNPHAAENEARQEAIERYRSQYNAAALSASNERQQGQILGFTRSDASAELNIALKENADLVRKETNERQALNNALAQSTSALANFGAKANEQFAGRDVQIAGLAKKINEEGGNAYVPGLGINDDETLKALQTKSDVAQFNYLAKQAGLLGATAIGGGEVPDITARAHGEFQEGIKAESDALKKSIGDTAFNLTTLSDVFKGKAAELGKSIVEKNQLVNGAADVSPLVRKTAPPKLKQPATSILPELGVPQRIENVKVVKGKGTGYFDPNSGLRPLKGGKDLAKREAIASDIFAGLPGSRGFIPRAVKSYGFDPHDPFNHASVNDPNFAHVQRPISQAPGAERLSGNSDLGNKFSELMDALKESKDQGQNPNGKDVESIVTAAVNDLLTGIAGLLK